MTEQVSIDFGQGKLIVEVGRVANQASGAVTVQVGGTVALVAAVASPEAAEDRGFFPLTVEYREKFYASGRIPGGFIKREGRPGESETLNARLIDRSIRPLFPEGLRNEVQVYITVLSMDQENPASVPSIIGASLALMLSDIPFDGPMAAVGLGRIHEDFIINPTFEQLEKSSLDLVIAGTRESIVMAEGEALSLPDKYVLDAIELGHKELQRLLDFQEELRQRCGKEKFAFTPPEIEVELEQKVQELSHSMIEELLAIGDKKLRSKRTEELVQNIIEQLSPDYPEREADIKNVFEEEYRQMLRQMVLDKKVRIDGRGYKDVRPITCEVAVLPRTHGSALFSRGQTQSLATVTLGSTEDQQTIDNILGIDSKRFMLHYNFPSYSVGEVRPVRGPGRREIGHGALAERALEPVIPAKEKFPYTIRVVSEILESNGSSSMASVCSGCLGLMDAGVPVLDHVAGLSIGLVREGDRQAILSDIVGLEDHFGDMDFKIAATNKGITAIQLDIKTRQLSLDIIGQALEQAREGNMQILENMRGALASPRPELSVYAPRIQQLQVNPEKIGALIGPSGRVIKGIIEKTGAKIDIEDDGTVYVFATDAKGLNHAVALIEEVTADVEINKTYTGKVVKVATYGALVEILPGRVGLVHISELDDRRVNSVTDICREGDQMLVKVLDIDEVNDRIRLSRKAAMTDAGHKS